MEAVLGEFGQALAQEGADQILGSGEVGLEDREFEVEGGVCHWIVVGHIGPSTGQTFDRFDLRGHFVSR